MEARLIPLNAVLALLRGDGEWPTPLGDQRLACERLELPVTTSRSLVVVDVLSLTDPFSTIVPIEAKGGANIEPEQAAKYLAMTNGDVARVVTMAPSSPAATVQPMIVCLEEHEAKIRLGLAEAEASMKVTGSPVREIPELFAVLSISDTRARLITPESSSLVPFEVEVPGPPPRIIPFDAESPDEIIQDPLVLLEAQVIIGDWKHEYNHRRPHSSLGWLAPTAYAEEWRKQPELLNQLT